MNILGRLPQRRSLVTLARALAFLLLLFPSTTLVSQAAPTVVAQATTTPPATTPPAPAAAGIPKFNDAAAVCSPPAPKLVAISALALIPVALLIICVLLGAAAFKTSPTPAVAPGSSADRLLLGLVGPAIGADGRLSLSKLQFYAWTIVIVYCYSVLALFRFHLAWTPQCILDAASQLGTLGVPSNVWIVLGLSSATLVGAKGITNSQIRNNLISKTRVPPRVRFSDLLWDDTANSFSLTRLQMLVWTLVAVSVYVIATYSSISAQDAIYQTVLLHTTFPPVSADLMTRLAQYPGLHFVQGIPDVDYTLLILMGLSQATYIGNKLAVVTPPAIYSLAANRVRPDDTITINGNNFGNTATTGQVILNSSVLPSNQIIGWADSQITVAVADWSVIVSTDSGHQVRSATSDAAPVTISVASSGVPSAENMLLQVVRPSILSILPQPAANGPLTITGTGFGATQHPNSNVFLNGQPLAATSWSDTQIVSGTVAPLSGQSSVVVRNNGLESVPYNVS